MVGSRPALHGESHRYEAQIVALRRHLHRHPELSGEEYGTSEKVQEELEKHGIPFTSGYAEHARFGVIEGGPGEIIALRAALRASPTRPPIRSCWLTRSLTGCRASSAVSSTRSTRRS